MTTKVMNGLHLGMQRLQAVADPSTGTDGANKQYVDSVAAGRDWKESVRVASTANVTLSAPGATLNGVTMAVNDRVLLKNQTTGSENGIWVWNGAAVPMTRATDAASGTVLTPGATVAVTEGTVDADTRWTLTTDGAITVGTTAQVWSKDAVGGGGTYVAGNGLTESPAGTFNVGSGTGITVAADSISIDATVVARKYSITVGNGALTTIPVTHNLGTRAVLVQVYDSTTYEEVLVDNVRTDANTVNLIFAVAPASGAFTVVVIG